MHRITQGDYGQQSSWDKERVKYVKKYKTIMYDSEMCLILFGAAAITWTHPNYLLGCWDPCLRAIHRVACPPAGVSIGHWSIIHTIHISKCVYLLIVCSGICIFIYYFSMSNDIIPWQIGWSISLLYKMFMVPWHYY